MDHSEKKKSTAGKKAVIIIESFLGVLLILCFSGSLVVNSYLDKINYDPGTEPTFTVSQEQDSRTESTSSDIQTDTLENQVENNLPVSTASVMYDKDVFNVLLIGSDTKAAGDSGRSDSMILLSVNRKTSKITLTSLLRDIYLQIPNVSLGNRLNAANEFGGPALLLDTIRKNFQIKVDKYIAVDFFSFMTMIDKIGGVDMNVTDEEIKVANESIQGINGIEGLPLDDGKFLAAGKQTLTGKQALGFARIRYVGNGDFDRTDRQRLIIGEAFSKMKTLNIARLNDLLNAFLPEITTNLTKSDLISLMLSIPAYANYTIDSWHVPADGTFFYSTVRGMSVLKIDFSKNIAEMQKKIYG